jgi:hypothetical protein
MSLVCTAGFIRHSMILTFQDIMNFLYSLVGSPARPYDLLWPVGRRKEIQKSGGQSNLAKVVELKAKAKLISRDGAGSSQLRSAGQYATDLFNTPLVN